MTPPSTRRHILRIGAALGATGLAGCTETINSLRGMQKDTKNKSNRTRTDNRQPVSGSTDTTSNANTYPLRAHQGTVDVGADAPYQTWLYNGQFPGPALRITEGDRIRAVVDNQLPDDHPTTIHWHGIPLPNPMDGVPHVTQAPIEAGGSFVYDYEVTHPGTYFYHSHVDLQLDRGLYGPLIVEEQSPHVEYDREYTLMLDDYQPAAPTMPDGGMEGMMGHHGEGNHPDRPDYAGLLLNGALPTAAPTFDVQEGERVRLRFINASSATIFRVSLGGHPMTISHADGQPVEPVSVDAFEFGAGERYDAIVEANNPGTWTIRAAATNGSEKPARGVLRYAGDKETTPTPLPSSPEQILAYEDLHSTRSLDGLDGSPDQMFDVTLSMGMGDSMTWLINGQTYSDAAPFRIHEGDHVRVRMTNHSPMAHPMHLHGHFFRVGDAIKDTVMVPARMGQVTFDFHADNPGNWLFHCHFLYHLESGMARVFEYIK